MFKMIPICTDTSAHSMSSLVHCPVNDAVIKAEPLVNQTFFQVVDVTNLAAAGKLVPTKSPKSPGCSVATAMS